MNLKSVVFLVLLSVIAFIISSFLNGNINLLAWSSDFRWGATGIWLATAIIGTGIVNLEKYDDYHAGY